MTETETTAPDKGARTPLHRISGWVAGLVEHSIKRPIAIVCVSLVIGLATLFYTIDNFDIRTDLDSLIAADLGWRAELAALEHHFPTQGDDVVLVIDGDTPELAERAAAQLTEKLAQRTDLFAYVSRANGGPFFDRAGVLFLTQAEVQETTQSLIAAQPILGPLASDPSLRGLMNAIATGIASADPAQTVEINRALTSVNAALTKLERNERAYFSWRALISGETEAPSEWRQFVNLTPKLDYSDLLPSQRHVETVRALARELKLDPAHGVQVKVTGAAPIGDDELVTLNETVGPIGGLMLAGMLLILFLAVRSPRIIAAIMITVLIGSLITSAIGLLIYSRFNLISVAFFPLFVGLGIDFAIQFCVRARADLTESPSLNHAMIAAAFGIGGGLALAAMSTAAGFLAFLPTDYRGVSELGMIAGVGMIIAFGLTVTLLPALLTLFGVRGGEKERGLGALRGADASLFRKRWFVVTGGLALAAVANLALPMLEFNFDPMLLRSPKNESMAVYLELARSPDTTPNTVSILAPNVNAAAATARHVARAPEVAMAATIQDFIPPDQDAKLLVLADARALLDFSLNPFFTEPAPTDADIVLAMRAAIDALRAPTANGAAPTPAALALASSLERLAAAAPARRAAAQHALLDGWPTALAQINSLLAAELVTLETLPAEIKRDWVSAAGHARVEVFPRHQLSTTIETARFVRAVKARAQHVSGDAVNVIESGRTILTAFLQAGLLSAAAIIILLLVTLRSFFWTGLTVLPVLISGVLTFATCALLGQVINLENMIALPLLLGIGVAFNIYFIAAWRTGAGTLLDLSLARAVLFSALTTGTAFAALAFSAHPGTASMGMLLIIALFWILATTLIFLPALLFVATRRAPTGA